IVPAFTKKLVLKLMLKANGTAIQSVTVNGNKVSWKNISGAIESPIIEIAAGIHPRYDIKINWSGEKTVMTGILDKYIPGSKLNGRFPGAAIQKVFDPQNVLQQVQQNGDGLTAVIRMPKGNYVFFVQLK